MPESKAHKNAKQRAAGPRGETEISLPNGKRLDARNSKKATEVERSGAKRNLEDAAARLKTQKILRKDLLVPQPDLKKGVNAMQKLRVSGTVKNMSGTKIISVKKAK